MSNTANLDLSGLTCSANLRLPSVISDDQLRDLVGPKLALSIAAKLQSSSHQAIFAPFADRQYLLEDIQDFISNNMLTVVRAWPHKQLPPRQRNRFLTRAYRLMSRIEEASFIPVYEQLAEEFGLSREVVQLNIRRAFFPNVESLFSRQLYAQESKLETDQQISCWRSRHAFWMHYEVFDSPYADFLFLDTPEPRYPERVPRYFKACEDLDGLVISHGTPLNAQQEQYLFARYNYLKCKVWHGVRALNHQTEGAEEKVQTIRDYIREVIELQERLVYSNLALVLSAAERVFPAPKHTAEIVAEGSLTLLRAVERFDLTRGVSFGHFVYRATVNAGRQYLATILPQRQHREAMSDMLLDRTALREYKDQHFDGLSPVEVRKLMLETLTHKEQAVIIGVFFTPGKNRTLKEVAQHMNLSIERVRQLKERALLKLRHALTEKPDNIHL